MSMRKGGRVIPKAKEMQVQRRPPLPVWRGAVGTEPGRGSWRSWEWVVAPG